MVEHEELNQSNADGDGREIVTIKLIRSQFPIQVQRTEWEIGYTLVLVQRNEPFLIPFPSNTTGKISV